MVSMKGSDYVSGVSAERSSNAGLGSFWLVPGPSLLRRTTALDASLTPGPEPASPQELLGIKFSRRLPWAILISLHSSSPPLPFFFQTD